MAPSPTENSKKNLHTCLVIPVYNEADHIEEVILNAKSLSYINRIIVVDDGSTDMSRQIAEKNGVQVVSHLINRGAGAAIQTGLTAAICMGAEIIITMDGDSQFNPENIVRLIEPIQDGTAEVVIGSRFLQKNNIPILRRFYNFIASIVTFMLSSIYVSDSQSGFKAFSRKAAQNIHINTNGYEFCSEMIREIGFLKLKYKEVPIDVYYTAESMRKGQNFAGGVKTVGKLFVRSLMR